MESEWKRIGSLLIKVAFTNNPINEAMAAINEDKKKLEGLQTAWAAAAQGVDMEEDENTQEDSK